jgi:hypothetical protein
MQLEFNAKSQSRQDAKQMHRNPTVAGLPLTPTKRWCLSRTAKGFEYSLRLGALALKVVRMNSV